MYVRKSDDVDEILDVIQDCVIYIKSKMNTTSANKPRQQYIFMERWTLDALQEYMQANAKSAAAFTEIDQGDDRRTLAIENSPVLLKEWNPEDDSSSSTQLSITAPDYGMRPRVAAEQSKELIKFEYVFCIGGDGTLLRLLRILFFRFLPSSLPKIVTFSMGSLGYLCNFKIKEFMKVLNATVLMSNDAIMR